MKPKINQIDGIPNPTEADVGKGLAYLGNGSFKWSEVAGQVPATPDQSGTVELATVAQVLEGLDNVRAVTAAGLKAHSDLEREERNLAILAALEGAINPDGSGVSAAYVQNLIATEGNARTAAIAAAIGGEITARDVADALVLAAAKAYTDSKVITGGGGGTTPPTDTIPGGGGGTDPTPGGGTVPARAIRDRSGSPLTDRFGQYIEYRIPIVTPVDPGDGTPPPVETIPVGAYVDRNGSPIKMRDGTFLMQRTAPDVVVPVDPVDPTPDPEPVVVYPTTPHLRLTSLHSHAIIEYQDGINARVRLVRPMYQLNGILSIKEYNAVGEGEFFYTYTGPNGLLSKYNGISAITRELDSSLDGSFTTEYVKSIGNGNFATLNMTFIISSQRTGPIPLPSAPVGRDEVILFDDFLPGTGTGAMPITYGNIRNTENGTLLLLGRASCMSPPHPDKRNTDEYGYGNGLYEFRARMIGDLGNAGGPCILLWPASNNWPGPEVDMGEFFADGTMYFANHWKDASYPVENNQQDRKTIWPIPAPFDPYVWNTYGARLSNQGVIFYMNGVEFARDHFSPAPKDFKNGGENHTIGLLSGSDTSSDGSPTGLECDWVRFTPEALIGVDPGETPEPPTEPVNPTQPPISISTPTVSITGPVAAGTLVEYTIVSTGLTNIGYVKVGTESTGYQWIGDPIYRPTTGTFKVSIPINNTGEFLKALPPEGYDYNTLHKDGPRITVTTNSVPAPSTGDVWYEDFSGNNQGKLNHAWGDTGKISYANGEMTMAGSSAGVGLQMLCNGADKNFGNGLFEIRAKFSKIKGFGSGPALVLWPSDNIWPGSEIDIGEVNAGGQVYYATHWRGSNGEDQASYHVLPWGFDPEQYHTYAAFLQTNKITYYIDGTVLGTETAHPAPDFANGGVNHSIGVMNRSSETWLTCDWMRFTPEANVLAGTSPVTPPVVTPTVPLDGSRINVFIRGQSNALLFVDRGGVWTMRDEIQRLTGKTVDIFAEFGSDTSTIHSGTPFMTWERDGQQASMLRYVNQKMTAAQKARPTVILWMHNEYEQNNWQLVQSQYEAMIRSDAIKLRAALGQPASKTPYLFAQIRYNYGNAFGVVNGAWIALKNDSSFNASITYETAASDILMDGDGYAGSSHMGNEDTHRAAYKLAPIIRNIINAQ